MLEFYIIMKMLDYDNIKIIRNKCIVNSRSECDTAVKFGPKEFKLPVVPANMQTVMNETLAEWFAENEYFYIMHRFDEAARIPFVKKMHSKGLFASISVGIKAREFEFVEKMANDGVIPEYITIDIAHGHSDAVIHMIQHIKKHIPDSFVIAGNVGTPEGVRVLENAGADETKVGIGPGRVCITKIKTGFGTGSWQLAALNHCSKAARKPIIADGGIRTHGDIAKSIRFGASMVMIGSLFAAHEESPGETVELDGKLYKEYFGSASEFQKGEHKNVEGKKMFVEHKGSLMDTLVEMQQDLQSSISYAGCNDLNSLTKVDYVIVRNSIFNGDRD